MNVVTWFVGRYLAPAHLFGAEAPAFSAASRASVEPRPVEPLADWPPARSRAADADLWVALTGEAVDRDALLLACAMAQEKRAGRLRALYCIEAPRSVPVDQELPLRRQLAERALQRAAEVAASYRVGIDGELLQARSAAEGIARALAAAGRRCATLVVGSPYRADGNGEAQLSELAGELLRSAPCRVYVVRGMPPGGGRIAP